jgi:hypothetical protein
MIPGDRERDDLTADQQADRNSTRQDLESRVLRLEQELQKQKSPEVSADLSEMYQILISYGAKLKGVQKQVKALQIEAKTEYESECKNLRKEMEGIYSAFAKVQSRADELEKKTVAQSQALESLKDIQKNLLDTGERVDSIVNMAEPHGGWEHTLEVVAQFKESVDTLNQLRDANLQEELEKLDQREKETSERAANLEKRLGEMIDMADPHGGWETTLEKIALLKENNIFVEDLKSLNAKGKLAEIEGILGELTNLLHLADPHGGWETTLEKIALLKENNIFVEDLKSLDAKGKLAEIEGILGELTNLLHLADPHGGWEHTLEVTARFKEEQDFLARIKGIDYDSMSRFFAALRKENLVVRMKRLERKLSDLDKVYQIHDLLVKFKDEQKLLLE